MIFLKILSIIGIVLLVILAIILLLLLLILFFPVSYRVKGKMQEGNTQLTASAYWLFHALGYRFSYVNGNTDSYYNIFFIKKHKGESDDEEEEDDDAESDDDFDDDVDDDVDDDIVEADAVPEEKEKIEPVLEADFSDTEEETEEAEAEEEEAEAEEEEEDEEVSSKSSSKSKRIIRRLKGYIKKFKRFWNNPVYRRAFDKLKKELIKLLMIINPRRFKLNCSFSAGAPDLTGQALGLIAIFPIIYQNRWKIYPDFQSDKPYAKGKADISGRVYLISLIGIIIRILVDKDCRKLYNDFKK